MWVTWVDSRRSMAPALALLALALLPGSCSPSVSTSSLAEISETLEGRDCREVEEARVVVVELAEPEPEPAGVVVAGCCQCWLA
jgi:hypothetical protein